MKLAVGLVHWPIRDKQGHTVATNITNLDVHDIARVSKVYGLDSYYVIHPSDEQLMFVSRLLEHWRIGEGSKLNPIRAGALTIVKTAKTVEEVIRDFDPNVLVVGTTARNIEGVERISFGHLKKFLKAELGKPDLEEQLTARIDAAIQGRSSVLLLFGTGFGMTEDFLKGCHLLLEPLKGAPPLDYRHLSVRSAVSICLDRLLGAW